jgi:hypothetical protein
MPLQNVRSISVAAGATLKTETEVVISSLKVDVGGAGTMDGFTFAENGTINVLADATSQLIELPGTYVNCIGLENIAGWDVEVNGNRTQKFTPEVVDGRIRLRGKGFTLIFR